MKTTSDRGRGASSSWEEELVWERWGRWRGSKIVSFDLSLALFQLIVRVNGGIHKSQAENIIEFSDCDKPSLREIIKNTCKRFGCKEKASNSLIYSKKGIQLFDEDINFIQPNDILYIALDGKEL